MKNIYIVSGFMRSGTSMMMDALSTGGLEPAFNKSRDEMNTRFGDEKYKPNPKGFYELNREEYQQLDFPKMYDGKLIKCLWGGLPNLAVHNYKIVFMTRDPEEIRQSYEAFFDVSAPSILSNYGKIMCHSIKLLYNRKDTEVVILRYREVVNLPLKAFSKLRNSGWPIDPYSAASVIDSSLCRFRLENLEIGI